MIGGSSPEQELVTARPWSDRCAQVSASERTTRIDRARALLAERGADAVLINAGPSLRYFAGIPWGGNERMVAMLLPVSGEPRILCPAFEKGSLEAALQISADLCLWEEDHDPFALVAAQLKPGALIAADPLLPFHWGERLRDAGLELLDGSWVIDGCRTIKSPIELALMSEAKTITLEVHRRAARILSPGIRASEVVRFIDDAHRAIGGQGSTFCAVQFGRATAFPHGLPGDQALEENQLVLIDTGTTVDGYNSDITRTYAFGKVGDDEHRLWNVEKEAQAAAFDAVAPGVPCEEIDATARRVIERAGLGPGYQLPGLPHRTGHGIGLAIHEAPYLVCGDRTPLAAGMCFSNEPMIVVPDRFGIRLEDHMYVTENGAAWFTTPQVSLDKPF